MKHITQARKTHAMIKRNSKRKTRKYDKNQITARTY